MPANILVGYATRTGSTAEVAEAIAEVLRAKGYAVTVSNVRQVRGVGAYSGFVLGSAVRMGKLMPEMLAFAARHAAQIRAMPTACFSVGIAMNEDTPENRQQAQGFIQPLVDLAAPQAVSMFGGRIDPARLGLLMRWVIKMDKTGAMPVGDFRDFKAIRAWAEKISPLFQ